MAKRLLVIEGDDTGQFFLSAKAETLTVGADPKQAAAVLRGLRVLRLHCEVEMAEDVVVLRTDQTTPGAPPRGQNLRLGDALHIDGARLSLALLEAPAAVGAVLRTTGQPGPDDKPAPPSPGPAAQPGPALPPAAETAPAGQHRRLLVIDGADHGRAYPLPRSGRLVIGKNQRQADIVLHDLYVSHVHCALQVEDARILVTHVEGPGGTLINGKKVTQHELHLGDILRVGNSHLRLEVGAAPARAAGETADDQGAYTVANPAESRPKKAGTASSPAQTPATEPPAPAPCPLDALLKLEGQVVGHYQVGALLGRGHCGVVFRAQDRHNNHTVALKVLAPDFPKSDAELQSFAQALKGVAPLRHAHLVTLYAVGKAGPYCWLAREYVEGESVRTLLGRLQGEVKLSWKRACRVAIHVGRVLDFLAQRGVTHSNITPANILLQSGTKQAKLADLMVDRALEGSQLQEMILEKKLLAELPYWAPEQTDPEAVVDQRTGLYALGAVVYALLTGQPPFNGASPEEVITQIREADVVKPSKILRETPAPFEAAVLKMIARPPEERFQTAAEMLDVVEPLANMHEIAV